MAKRNPMRLPKGERPSFSMPLFPLASFASLAVQLSFPRLIVFLLLIE